MGCNGVVFVLGCVCLMALCLFGVVKKECLPVCAFVHAVCVCVVVVDSVCVCVCVQCTRASASVLVCVCVCVHSSLAYYSLRFHHLHANGSPFQEAGGMR